MNEDKSGIRIVLHAPSAASLSRARSNVANLVNGDREINVRIVVNAGAVAVVLDEPDVVADPLTLICPNSLKKISRSAGTPLTVLPEAGVLALARMQADGWHYVRA